MCGIVAAISPAANIVPILLEGLRKLEYRGYNSAGIADASGAPVERPVVISQLSADAVELGHYRHYMQGDIFEQPEALANTLELIGNGGRLQPGIFGTDAADLLASVRSVLIRACGTSYHSGVTARYWLESLAGMPCTVEIASEYRYRSSVPDPDQLVVAISQSGETADTLAALRHAKDLGHTRTMAICNVPESAIVRECALRFITRAGPEIGVSSTKAFTTQLAALFLLTLAVGKLRGRIDEQAGHGWTSSDSRRRGPRLLRQVVCLRRRRQPLPRDRTDPRAAATGTLPRSVSDPARGTAAVTREVGHC